MKICSKCFTEKPVEEFHKLKTGKYGVAGHCKVCDNARKVTYLANNQAARDKNNARSSKWQKDNSEKRNGYMRAYISANPEYLEKQKQRRSLEDKDAQRAKARELYAFNREKILERKRQYAKEHPEQKQKYRDENREACRKATNAWQKANPAKNCEAANRRRAQKLNATPLWANTFFMEEAYLLAELRTRLTGIAWHVDHIVPLQNKLVCGLHTDSNLQVIPAKQNIRKHNRFDPDAKFFNTACKTNNIVSL